MNILQVIQLFEKMYELENQYKPTTIRKFPLQL
jgi:hypothetical protein